MSRESALASKQAGDAIAGFVDVGGFAAQSALIPRSEDGRDPWLSRRAQLDLPQGPLTVAVARLDAGASRSAALPGDEFVLVREGDLTVRQSGVQLVLPAGECAVIPRNVPFEWSSERGASLVIMRCTGGGGAGSAHAVRIDKTAERSASNPPIAELLVGPTPSCRNHSDYRSQTGEFVCGTWDSTPYHRRLMMFRHYELMALRKGQVTFVDGLGRSGTFGAGDIVLLRQGGGCSWESREYVEKIYATWRPAA